MQPSQRRWPSTFNPQFKPLSPQNIAPRIRDGPRRPLRRPRSASRVSSRSRKSECPFLVEPTPCRRPLSRASRPFIGPILKGSNGSIALFRQTVQQGLLFAHSGRPLHVPQRSEQIGALWQRAAPLGRHRRLDPLNGPDSHAMRRRNLHDAGLAETQIGADRSFLHGVDRRPAERLPLRLRALQARLDVSIGVEK